MVVIIQDPWFSSENKLVMNGDLIKLVQNEGHSTAQGWGYIWLCKAAQTAEL